MLGHLTAFFLCVCPLSKYYKKKKKNSFKELECWYWILCGEIEVLEKMKTGESPFVLVQVQPFSRQMQGDDGWAVFFLLISLFKFLTRYYAVAAYSRRERVAEWVTKTARGQRGRVAMVTFGEEGVRMKERTKAEGESDPK